MGLNEQFARANRRAREMHAMTPTAVSACYDRKTGRVVIDLSSGLQLRFPPGIAEGLEKARPTDLEKIEITPSGYGIHFPELDADLYLPALLEGVFGSRRWMASRLGRFGGSSKSPRKAVASRRNGKLGGRPPKRRLAKVK
jgi:Protein of unknown function (DUF2442)